MDLEALLDPRKAKVLQRSLRDRAIADQSLRRLWHTVFDPVPELLALAGDDNARLFEGFVCHCIDLHLPMDWRLHLHLSRWLEKTPWGERIKEIHNESEIWLSLLGASCGSWVRQDRSRYRVIAALNTETSLVGAVAEKKRDFRKTGDVFIYEFPMPNVKGVVVARSESIVGIQGERFRICA